MMSKRMPLALALSAVLTLTSAYAQDNWNGGTGNWSNGSDWSAGEPGAGSDVVIYGGGSDTVTLDTSPTINSLTLGGENNGYCQSGYYCSELTDGGVAQTLTITNGLTVGQTGNLNLSGGSTVTAGALVNNGLVGEYYGSYGGSVTAAALTNNGSINDVGSVTAGALVNSGSMEQNGLTLQINGDVNNSGIIQT